MKPRKHKRFIGTRQIDKRTPGGRFDGRAYARGRVEHAAGRPVTTHPWRVIRRVTAPIQEPHVGLIIDTSGSMAAYEYALGPIAWILTDGLRQVGGRCATALFGTGAELLSDGSRPLDGATFKRMYSSFPRGTVSLRKMVENGGDTCIAQRRVGGSIFLTEFSDDETLRNRIVDYVTVAKCLHIVHNRNPGKPAFMPCAPDFLASTQARIPGEFTP